jgi:hypothetical protein
MGYFAQLSQEVDHAFAAAADKARVELATKLIDAGKFGLASRRPQRWVSTVGVGM